MSRRTLLFLAAEALSAVGSWATIVVVWGYAAYEYDASAADVSIVGLGFSVPAVLLGPVAGTVIDRVGPKATLAGAKVLGIVSALLMLTADSFEGLALLVVFHGISMSFSYPALQALPPRVVDDEHLARTNALVGMTDELSIVFGPVVAGVAIALFDFRGAFLVDAATYALGLAALPLVALRPKVREHDEEDDPPVRFRDAFEGWRLIRRTDALRRSVGLTFSVHLLYGAALLCEPLYVRDTLHESPRVFAALQTAFGICMVLGGILATRTGDRIASLRWVAFGVVGSGISAVVYLGTPWIVVAFLGVGLWGIATAVIAGPSRTVLQRATPQRAHGRVLSADLMAGNGGELVGLAIAGLIVSTLSVPWAIGLLGTGVALAAIWLGDLRGRRGSRTTVAACAPLDDSGSTPSSVGASRSASPQ